MIRDPHGRVAPGLQASFLYQTILVLRKPHSHTHHQHSSTHRPLCPPIRGSICSASVHPTSSAWDLRSVKYVAKAVNDPRQDSRLAAAALKLPVGWPVNHDLGIPSVITPSAIVNLGEISDNSKPDQSTNLSNLLGVCGQLSDSELRSVGVLIPNKRSAICRPRASPSSVTQMDLFLLTGSLMNPCACSRFMISKSNPFHALPVSEL